MSRIKWSFILGVVFFINSSSKALAAEQPLVTDDFCNYPYEAICNAPEYTPEKTKEKIKDFKEAIKRGKEFMVDGANELFNPGYYKRLVRSEYHLEQEALNHVATIQTYLDGSVKASSLPSDITLNMEQKIANVPIITLTSIKKQFFHPTRKNILKTITLPLQLALSGLGFVMTCGLDGLTINAFVTGGNLILCPGWLVASLGNSPEENLEGNLQVLGHEMGHLLYMDNSLKHTYSNYQSCLEKYPTDGLDRSISADMNEISADYWGVETIAQYFKDEQRTQARGRELGYMDRLNTLRRSFSGLCGSRAGGGHPNGRYRIETLLRRNPDINATMGCAVTKKESSFGCALDGMHEL